MTAPVVRANPVRSQFEDNEMHSAVKAGLQELANNLAQRMRERGMTQRGLAEASGISPRTVGYFLRPHERKKELGSGTLAHLIQLANALEIEPAALLRCRNDMARDRFNEDIEAAFVVRLKGAKV